MALRRRYGHQHAPKVELTEAQNRALLAIARSDFGGIRSATYGALFGAGLIGMTHDYVEQRYRPTRAWSDVRWSRRRLAMTDCWVTPAGEAYLKSRGVTTITNVRSYGGSEGSGPQ